MNTLAPSRLPTHTASAAPTTTPPNATPTPISPSNPTPKPPLHAARAAFDVWVEAALVPEAPEDVPIAVADVRELAPEDRDGAEVALPDAVVDTTVPDPLPEGAVIGSVVGDEMDESGGMENGGVVVSWVVAMPHTDAERELNAVSCAAPQLLCTHDEIWLPSPHMQFGSLTLLHGFPARALRIQPWVQSFVSCAYT